MWESKTFGGYALGQQLPSWTLRKAKNAAWKMSMGAGVVHSLIGIGLDFFHHFLVENVCLASLLTGWTLWRAVGRMNETVRCRIWFAQWWTNGALYSLRIESAYVGHDVSESKANEWHQRCHGEDIRHEDHPQNVFDGHTRQDGQDDGGDDEDAETNLWRERRERVSRAPSCH